MAMEIINTYWLCDDCTVYACNGDLSGLEGEDRVKDVQEGVDKLAPLAAHWDEQEGVSEFSHMGCDACTENARKSGPLHRFAQLAEYTPVYLKLCAPQYRNGNPRRGWLVWSPNTGRTVAFIDEGYDGDGHVRRLYPNGVDLGTVNVPASEYRKHMRADYAKPCA